MTNDNYHVLITLKETADPCRDNELPIVIRGLDEKNSRPNVDAITAQQLFRSFTAKGGGEIKPRGEETADEDRGTFEEILLRASEKTTNPMPQIVRPWPVT